MADTPELTREYRNHHLDSTRWENFERRSDDIVVCTSYKAGTTWMQRIVSLLVLGDQPLPTNLRNLSPWIDARFWGPIDAILEGLEAQEHRRFVKSHLAADGLPFWPDVRYVIVARDTRDVFMSLWNHYSSYTDLTLDMMNDAERPGDPLPRAPEDPRELWPRWITEGWFDWEEDGWPFWSHHHHASTWWPHRDLPNVLLVHFNDLLADLDGEMRRVAGFLDIEVDEDAWPRLVEAATFSSMKAEAKEVDEREGGMTSAIFQGGTDRFFHKGTNGRWRDVLTEEDLDLYEKAAVSLDPDLRAWLEGGRLATGSSRR